MDVQPEAKQTADSDSPQLPTARRTLFRVIHIVYVVTLVCTAVATFGQVGLFVAIAAILIWGSIFRSPSRPAALAKAIIVAIMIVCTGILFVPGVVSHEASPRAACSNNLKQIAFALDIYHDTYKSFPPAFIPDENGKPMHSWRVLILPLLEYTALYDQYDFDEPWNGPNNRKLAKSMPNVYECPDSFRSPQYRNGSTGYVAVVGPETTWPGVKGRKMSEIKDGDGTSSTILVVEAPELAIHWMEPRDPSLEDAIRVLSSPDEAAARSHSHEDLLYTYSGGRHTAFADGSVYFVSHGVSSEAWRAMFTINGEEELSDGDMDPDMAGTRWPKIGKFISLGAFLLMLTLPLPWVWLNPASGQ